MDFERELAAKLKIYTVFHKPSFIPPAPYLHPVQAGRAVAAAHLNMQGDDDGENISALNPAMCEITVLYNIYKNKKYFPAEYWGLCHYRRYFSLHIHWSGIKKKRIYYKKGNHNDFRTVFSKRLAKFCWITCALLR